MERSSIPKLVGMLFAFLLGFAVHLLIDYSKAQTPAIKQNTNLTQPSAQFGYQYKPFGAYIVDTLGNNYFMEFKLYDSLFRKNGFDAVTGYRDKHTNDKRIHPYVEEKFHRSFTNDAIAYSADFWRSYSHQHQVYLSEGEVNANN